MKAKDGLSGVMLVLIHLTASVGNGTAGAVVMRLRAIILAAAVVGFLRLKVGIAVRLVHSVDELLDKALKLRSGQRRDEREREIGGEP